MAIDGNVGVKYGLYIDGGYCDAAGDDVVASIDPSTGEQWYSVPNANDEDVDRAVRAAVRAFEQGPWPAMTVSDRRRVLLAIAEHTESLAESLAITETRDNGRIIRETRAQVEKVAEVWEYFAGWPDKFGGTLPPSESSEFLTYVRPEPIGVIGAIVPWNAPLLLATVKLAPALAAGNTVVIKPSEHTSASLLEFTAVLERAGVPPGVVNVVTGLGATTGDALSRHPDVRHVTFTGGTETGRRIATRCAERLVPATLELGGKSPNIVFDDAPRQSAAEGVAQAIFSSAGEMCVAGSRCFIQESAYDEVLDAVVAIASKLRIGDPLDEETDMGPLAFKEHLERTLGYVKSGVDEGASVRLGGRRASYDGRPNGFFVEPTILEGVTNRMRVAREEIFGPVLCVMPFRDEDAVIKAANDTKFGLTAGVWTRDLARAHRVAHRLDAGWVWVNDYRTSRLFAPFGGFKESGYGKETALEAMREVSRFKTICMNLGSE